MGAVVNLNPYRPTDILDGVILYVSPVVNVVPAIENAAAANTPLYDFVTYDAEVEKLAVPVVFPV